MYILLGKRMTHWPIDSCNLLFFFWICRCVHVPYNTLLNDLVLFLDLGNFLK